jgi:predicted DNA-binding protein (MmcQ/YjbR family)
MANLIESDILDLLRAICARLPGTFEKLTYGHPAFATSHGLYAVVEEFDGELSLCIKVGFEYQRILLEDPRFYKTPYIGNRGWVSLKLKFATLDLLQVSDLLTRSYQMTTRPKRSRQKKDDF